MKNTNMKAIRRSVQLSGKILLLGFVLFIFSGIAYSQTNVAKGKTARQSSTRSAGGAANRAVDGNTSGVFTNNSVTHTASATERGTWWEVDLGRVYNIRQIRIYNRTDCCSERLNNIQVKVSRARFNSNSDGTMVADLPASANFVSLRTFNLNNQGRYVRIYKKSGGVLSLAEVEVFGIPITAPPTSPANNRNNAGTGQNLSGNWEGYFKDGRKSAYVWAIRQNGSTLSIQGVGQFANLRSSGRINGNQIWATDFNTRGTISSDARTIRWTDGVTWRKASSAPNRTDTTPRTNRNSNTQITGTRASREQQCYSLVQGKVAWNSSGNKRWSPQNIRSLCSQTINPARTVACFKSELNRYKNWSRASQICQNRFRGAPAERASSDKSKQLPGTISKYLDKRFKDWEISPESQLCGEKALFDSGDFNGDGKTDYVVFFVTNKNRTNSRQFLYAFLNKDNYYQPFKISEDAEAENFSSNSFAVNRKGETLQTGEGRDDVLILNVDAITEYTCETDGANTFLFSNGKFSALDLYQP